MARLPEGALMQRAAAGLAYAVLDLLGRGVRRPGAAAGRRGRQRRRRAVRRGAAGPARGARWRRCCSPDRAHAAGLAALRARGRPGRRRREPARAPRRGGRRDRRHRRPRRPARRRRRRRSAAFAGVPVVAVDTPSGVDVDTGELDGPHVRADVTVTFGTHKVAHLVDPAAPGLRRRAPRRHRPGPARRRRSTALQAGRRRGAAAAARRRTPTSTPAAWSASAPARSSTRAPGVLCVSGAGTGLAGMVRYVGRRPPTWSARSTRRSSSARAGCRPGWSAPAAATDAGQALADALADGVPVVVDADGAHATSTGPLGVPAVLTPHAGELARMLGVERERGRGRASSRYAREAARAVRRGGAAQGPAHAGRRARRRGAGHHDRAALAGHRRRRRRARRAVRGAARRRARPVRRRRRSARGCTARAAVAAGAGGPVTAPRGRAAPARGGACRRPARC